MFSPLNKILPFINNKIPNEYFEIIHNLTHYVEYKYIKQKNPTFFKIGLKIFCIKLFFSLQYNYVKPKHPYHNLNKFLLHFLGLKPWFGLLS